MTSLLEANAIAIEGRLAPTDLRLQAGTLTALIGPNGGGKTSLLRALARIDRPSGIVRIEREELDGAVPARRRHLLSFLPANRDVAWPISVRELIALGLDKPESGRIEDLLDQLELRDLADRPADRLSTGERARVLLARSLAARPRVLLLDEPLSNLDPYWVLRILALLRDCAGQGAAVLLALHDLSLLEAFERSILVAHGRLQADGSPQVILQHPSFEEAFRVKRSRTRWSISPSADQRSSL